MYNGSRERNVYSRELGKFRLDDLWGVMEFEIDDEYSNLGVTEVNYIICKKSRKKKKTLQNK